MPMRPTGSGRSRSSSGACDPRPRSSSPPRSEPSSERMRARARSVSSGSTTSRDVARRRRASRIEIVFETHSTTTDNERWIASGWLDGQLSLAGKRQAKELRERRGNEGLAAVFTSDLGRAVETAQLSFGGLGIPIFHDWRLRECDYGDLNGTPVA